jgi:hypothetical protein
MCKELYTVQNVHFTIEYLYVLFVRYAVKIRLDVSLVTCKTGKEHGKKKVKSMIVKFI